MPTDSKIDDYIAKKAEFARPILTEIRRRMHAIRPDFDESIKWGMPFFLLNDRPFANMAAFKGHASFGIWKAAEYGLDEEKEGMGVLGKLTALSELPDEAAFAGLIAKAVALSQSPNASPAKKPTKGEAEVPAILAEALAKDPLANATFEGFPPSSRREYCDWMSEAKREETRAKRVAQAIEWLREGKRRNWKYENC